MVKNVSQVEVAKGVVTVVPEGIIISILIGNSALMDIVAEKVHSAVHLNDGTAKTKKRLTKEQREARKKKRLAKKLAKEKPVAKK